MGNGDGNAKIIDLVAGVARLGGKIDTLTARFDAHVSRTDDERVALFTGRRENASNIAAIEATYVRRKDFSKHEEQQREDITALRDAINRTQVRVAGIVTAGTVAWALIALWLKQS